MAIGDCSERGGTLHHAAKLAVDRCLPENILTLRLDGPCVGHIDGPRFFPPPDTKGPVNYSGGIAGCLVGLICGAVFILALRLYFS